MNTCLEHAEEYIKIWVTPGHVYDVLDSIFWHLGHLQIANILLNQQLKQDIKMFVDNT